MMEGKEIQTGMIPGITEYTAKMAVQEEPVQEVFDFVRREAAETKTEEEIDLGAYEIVRPEFFSHIKEPALTVNVDKISVNAACVRMMPEVDCVQILVSRKEKKLLLLPCSETEISGYRWSRIKDGKRYPSHRTGEPFVLTLCKIMDWNPDYRYKILGKMIHANGKSLMAFDLTAFECFPKTISGEGRKVSSRRAVFAEEWSGRFGPTYSESKRSMQVSTLDGYTVFSVKGKNVKQKKEARAEDMLEKEMLAQEAKTDGLNTEDAPVNVPQTDELNTVMIPTKALQSAELKADNPQMKEPRTDEIRTGGLQTDGLIAGDAHTKASRTDLLHKEESWNSPPAVRDALHEPSETVRMGP